MYDYSAFTTSNLRWAIHEEDPLSRKTGFRLVLRVWGR
jgi:hypothetical protein